MGPSLQSSIWWAVGHHHERAAPCPGKV